MKDFPKISLDRRSAWAIIALVSFFILLNFWVGFNLAIYSFVFLVAFLLAFLRPQPGLMAVVFLTMVFERFFTLQPLLIGRSEYKLYPLDILLAGIFLGIGRLMLSGKVKPKWRRLDLLVLGFIILGCAYFVASLFGSDAEFSLLFSSFKNYAVYPLMYFAVVWLLEEPEDRKNFMLFGLYGALTIIFFVLYGAFSGGGLWTEYTPLSTEGIRLLAFTHAFYLSLAILGLLAWLLMGHRIKPSEMDLLILWTFGVVGSMMRHLWIGLIAAVGLMLFLVPRMNQKNIGSLIRYLAVAFLATAVILFYLFTIFPNSDASYRLTNIQNVIVHRLATLWSSEADESFAWRGSAWQSALQDYRQQPVLGLGFGRKVLVEVDNYIDFVEIRNIHNSWLVLLIQMGIPGILLMVLMLLEASRLTLKRHGLDWLDLFLISALAFYCIVALFQPYLETNLLGLFFWLILGLIGSRNRDSA